MKLTKREKWLMRHAYKAGLEEAWWDGQHQTLDHWLAEVVDDHGHTVEDLVAGEAPNDKEDGDESET